MISLDYIARILNFRREQRRDFHGRFSTTGGGMAGVPTKAELAKRTHKPATAEKQRRAEAEQARLAKVLGAKDELDNKPFDVTKGRHAVEVKTVIDNNNDKITMHPDSKRRKLSYARKNKLKPHTVVIDVRGGKRQYYYRKGVGSFRLGAMQPVSVDELRQRISR